ncbi:hypothetical protein CALCODRAFT_508897 [Calocera cornea HHB12733]|uniref:Uncharacterized protein n=1 Tax=Calocera cornea HHB12733 TaxID=1353952 RepID=A0A165FXL0_9BASI|nr:hypothetical protein CALCODRAFT_508897 [Calocera cornea HHB12733]
MLPPSTPEPSGNPSHKENEPSVAATMSRPSNEKASPSTGERVIDGHQGEERALGKVTKIWDSWTERDWMNYIDGGDEDETEMGTAETPLENASHDKSQLAASHQEDNIQHTVHGPAPQELGRFSVSDRIYNTRDGRRPVAGPSVTHGNNATRGAIRKRTKRSRSRTIQLRLEDLLPLITGMNDGSDEAAEMDTDWVQRKFDELEATMTRQQGEIDALKQKIQTIHRLHVRECIRYYDCMAKHFVLQLERP